MSDRLDTGTSHSFDRKLAIIGHINIFAIIAIGCLSFYFLWVERDFATALGLIQDVLYPIIGVSVAAMFLLLINELLRLGDIDE